MSEKKYTGKTYVDWSNLKKTSVNIDKDGNQTELPQMGGKPKSLEDFLERRRKRMGR